MSNKAVSVYAEAMKRQKQQEKSPTKQDTYIFSNKKQKTEEQIPGKKDRKTEVLQDRKTDRFVAFVSRFLTTKSIVHTTFRYPTELLEKLDQVQYEIKTRHKKKITKNSILVAALAYMLWDLEELGQESILYKLLVKNED